MTTAAGNEVGAALLRAGVYGLLAEAFCYPAPGSLKALENRWDCLLGWNGEWPDAIRDDLAGALADLRGADPAHLAGEYVRLFGPAACCPLTETSWGDAARLLGKAAQIADISGFYHAFKVQPRTKADAVPEDHLAVELEFMSILSLKEAYAINAGLGEELEITRDARNKFLEEHLAAWIDGWAGFLDEYAPAPFYRALASSLLRVIHAETARLGITPFPIHARLADPEAGSDTFVCPHAAAP